MSKCKCCGKENLLVRAHIYPKWAYKSLYLKGREYDIPLYIVTESNSRAKRSRTGVYDSTILCSRCDGTILSKLDNTGKKALIDATLKHLKKEGDNIDIFQIEKTDPLTLKRFVLSLLLRAHWSNTEVYRHVDLEEEVAARLKEYVTGGVQATSNDFLVLLTRFGSKELKEASLQYTQVPYVTKIDNIKYWVINLPNGYKIYIKEGAAKHLELEPFALSRNRPVYVIQLELFEESSEFNMLKKHLHKIKLSSDLKR